MRGSLVAHGSAWALLWSGVAGALGAGDPWADRVLHYNPGQAATAPYDTQSAVLGSPERFTGEGVFPAVVSVFNPPWGADELLRVSEGGSLIVEFDEPITNAPSHAFGVDVIVYGNSFFIDGAFPSGRVGFGGAVFGADLMHVWVSADGADWRSLGSHLEGRFPTNGYLDSGPYDDTPGLIPTDFTRPVNPALGAADFNNLTLPQVMALYGGAAGGTPIDIASSGLSSVRFVRIDVPIVDGQDISVEIDAFAAVPEPSAAMGTAALLVLAGAFRRGRP